MKRFVELWNRPMPSTWVVLALIIYALAFVIAMMLAAALAASHAMAAVNPDQRTPLSATQTAKDAIRAKPRCMTPRIFVLVRRLPDGKRVPVATVVALVPC